MKKFLTGGALLLAFPLVHAQSSVTLYGLMSTAIEYINNEGGHSNFKMLSGTMQNNRWGLRIVEDLGGGMSAVATLENGFDGTSGAFQQGGRMFGRQAWVGLSSTQIGRVTLGRQYDMFWDYMQQFEAATAANGLAVHIGDNDNAFGGFRYNNSVKYLSPNWAGFTVEALYAFSNQAGDFSLNRAMSFGASYSHGPIRVAVAYLDIDKPGVSNPSGAATDDYSGTPPFILFHTSPLSKTVGVDRQRQFGAGGAYSLGPVTWNLLVTDVRFRYLDTTSLHLDNYDTSLTYQLTPSVQLGAGYIFTTGNYGNVGDNSSMHWHTGQLSVDYSLSKRTDVYLFGDAVFASGARAVAVTWLNSPSSTKRQINAMAGIRHKF
ncbi:gram-negative porin family protein [Paraburkholderia xenovorans LB400]|uniref:Outer membrane porin, OmpC family n=1 Tax=Paraburkholderia xenovorans (strain LB400) TaxID=266265 RepID=Q13GA4_PARXL|nr:porin [Paraburkholderia xenovorans]ABE36885.1 outer membrane porin, OmpC family [Paraburkholderia xenovorans LB400]AIP33977.1 gram-negative porin family protein [Paraburkholderia xenovorans LB400]